MIIKNASQFPKRYFGLHMAEGCAEYKRPEGSSKIYLNEATLKKMDASFEGKPLYLDHRDVVTPDVPVDGYVVKSFYNKADGKHWVEFMATTDEAIAAIERGIKLSNAYLVSSKGAGGVWHGMDYEYEIIDAEYEHLALVDDPRYAESIILTPEEFRIYNENKEQELKLQNSKGSKTMFNFFKKAEESLDTSLIVTLPKSKISMELGTILNEMDEAKKNESSDHPKYVTSDMLVKVADEDLTVHQLVNAYCDMKNKMAEVEKAKADEEAKKNKDAVEKKKEEKPVENMEDEEKKENEDEEEEEEEKKQNSLEELENAHKVFNSDEDEVGQISGVSHSVNLGLKRYGSGK